jgi:alkyl sulfatase BDS1-like metallo-beta-lactamase superfamily hydrolase
MTSKEFKEVKKAATEVTKAENAALLSRLPFSDKQDFEFAARGFIATMPEVVIKDATNRRIWDLNQYDFIKGEAPVTINPSLWRIALLNMHHGLFKVTDGIYQVRGFDLSNISFVETDSGVIIIDPLVSSETAKVSLDFYYTHRPKKPVIAVIYTHSHPDHYGGVKGVASEEDVKAGKTKIIAPNGFMEAVGSEFVMAGNAMGRRASYQHGNLLPRGPQGQVDAGLGKVASTGTITLIPPTNIIRKTGEELTIGGVRIVFQLTPDTEAPAEMHFFFPQFKALCLAENANANLHNLYTLRGAQVRDTKAWAYYLKEAVRLFGDNTEVMFTTHHWPRWGQKEIVEFITKQADAYKYIHDQTLRLANHGYTMLEIAEMIKLPDSLGHAWYNRDLYGTVNHNAKGVYQKYLGWFDGNPCTLHALPPEEAGKKYVEFMGGIEAVIAKAEKSYEQGEYRWVAQVMNHVVFADPKNQKARHLAADALEQLGYQAESGTWRNLYLTGAMELREGLRQIDAPMLKSPDTVKALSLDLLFDYMATRLNGPKAKGKKMVINFEFIDTKQKYTVMVANSVLDYSTGMQSKGYDTHVILSRSVLDEILLNRANLEEKIATGEVKVSGEKDKLVELFSLLDKFEFWFNIVEP